jgi:hypothetical protein
MAERLDDDSQILVISKPNDTNPNFTQFMLRGGYSCTLVNSVSEADRLLETHDFDAIMYIGKQSVVIKPIHRFLYAS